MAVLGKNNPCVAIYQRFVDKGSRTPCNEASDSQPDLQNERFSMSTSDSPDLRMQIWDNMAISPIRSFTMTDILY